MTIKYGDGWQPAQPLSDVASSTIIIVLVCWYFGAVGMSCVGT
jgi:hypothetical protein